MATSILKVFAIMPKIMQLIDLVLQIAAELGVEKNKQVAVDVNPSTEIRFGLGSISEGILSEAEAVEPPAPTDVESWPIDRLFLVPMATSDQFPFDPNAKFRQEWYDPNAEADDPEEGVITYPCSFGVDSNNNIVFRSLTIPVEEARKANVPNSSTGNVDNRPYRRIPCRKPYSYEQIVRGQYDPLPGIGAFVIKNLAYKPPSNKPTEFTEGDREAILSTKSDVKKILQSVVES